VDSQGLLAHHLACRLRDACQSVFPHSPHNSARNGNSSQPRLGGAPNNSQRVWWIGTIVCVAGSFALTRVWSGPLALWIVVAVMDLIPVGAFALFVTLFIKAQSTFKAHGATLPTEPVVGALTVEPRSDTKNANFDRNNNRRLQRP
jgi:hypothetical protein